MLIENMDLCDCDTELDILITELIWLLGLKVTKGMLLSEWLGKLQGLFRASSIFLQSTGKSFGHFFIGSKGQNKITSSSHLWSPTHSIYQLHIENKNHIMF